MRDKKVRKLDIRVPISTDMQYSDTDALVTEKILDLYHRYGFDRFILTGPWHGWINYEYPPVEYFREKAQLAARVKETVAPYGIALGWWMATTLKTGAQKDFSNYVTMEGEMQNFTACPLDDKFKAAIAERMAECIKVVKPEFVVMEDDYSAYHGCFCERHLKEFARRMGRFYSREEIKEYHKSNDQEKIEVVRQWREFNKEVMLDVSRVIRAKVDEESPEITIEPFQAGATDYEGFSTEEHAKILAAKGHRPSSRIYGTYYSYDFDEKRLPEAMVHALYSKEHFDPKFKFIHETDAYPYSSYFISGNAMRALMATAFSYGFEGAIMLSTPLATHYLDEEIYNKSVADERNRLEAVYDVARQCEIKGVEICYDPFYNSLKYVGCDKDPLWTRPLGLFGIPYTTKKSSVAFWDEIQAQYADDATIREYLSKGIFLDGEAAKILFKRGYGEYLGVDVGDVVTVGTGDFDQCSMEVVRREFVENCVGNYMPNTRTWNLMGNGVLYALKPNCPGCEIVTEFQTFRHEIKAIAMTRFENSLGGKVVVMGTTLRGNFSQGLYNRQRQDILQVLIKWCKDEYAFVKRESKVFCIMNEATEETDFKGMLTLLNLSSDKYKDVCVHLPEKWRRNNGFKRLNIQGEWEDFGYSYTEDGVCIHEEIWLGDPFYILVK